MKRVCNTCGKEKDMFSWESVCFSCREKVYNEDMANSLRSGAAKSTDCESEIFCPYCGAIKDPMDNDDLYIGGGHEVPCGECGKYFNVTVDVTYTYSTERLEDEDEES